MIKFSNGKIMLTNSNITINNNTKYNDIDVSLYSEYGFNNPKYKVILLKDQVFYDSSCSIGLFILNDKLLESIILKEYKISLGSMYDFKWGSIFSIYDSKGGFSSIQIKYSHN